MLLLFCCGLCAFADSTGWTLLYEKEGFKAYEQKGPPLAYKAEGTMAVPLAEVAAVLVDVPRQREWVLCLAESRLLEGDPAARSVIYSRYALPWPARDRDAVIESVVEEDVAQREVRVRFRNVWSGAAPTRWGCIRVPLSEGGFTLRETGNGTVFVSYVLRIDPGGWLPDWIVRLFVRDAPHATLRAFLAQVKRTRGQYDSFIATQQARWDTIARASHGTSSAAHPK